MFGHLLLTSCLYFTFASSFSLGNALSNVKGTLHNVYDKVKPSNLVDKANPCFVLTNNCSESTLWLYTNDHSEGGIKITESTMKSLPIIKGAPWKILYHGFTCSKDKTPNPELREAYFKRGRYNIISADNTKPLAPGKYYSCYPTAVKNLPKIGECGSKLISSMIKNGIIQSADKLHLIGHSLGAHTVAHVANGITKRTGQRVFRITGLDPAAPLFWNGKKKLLKILDKSDGTFVDIHHTNGRKIVGKGLSIKIGTVDIIYNKGSLQPKCKEESGCSHHKVVEYYAESIYPLPPSYSKFYGKSSSTNDYQEVGEYISLGLTGTYDVSTNDHRPYAKGNPKDITN